ncbi:hypothetical protein [Fulvivirga ligni]|uniref:hypothetical protein n=1 Tax=Fulvivirga ligni TaxID=2904246 RepID=UPI001F2E18BB|nr:hypothetical protein [Fulvivirga ligni]UII20012.1 hypothetical protein LVD16_19390 [Fulvivirga ligni]
MRKYIAVLLMLLTHAAGYAMTEPDKKEKSDDEKGTRSEAKAPKMRAFKGLETVISQRTENDILKVSDFENPISDTLDYYSRRAMEVDQAIKENNKFVEVLDENTLIDMPVGIKKDIGGLSYSISLDSIVMTPTGAYLIAYMVFTEPSSGKSLTFRGTDIKLSKTGGLTGDARLELIGDQPINIFGSKSLMTLKGDGTTYVEFDCNGFKLMGIGADIVFSRDLIVPENADGTPDSTRRVTANLRTTLSNWNDLIAEVDLPAFQIKGVKGVGFKASTAIFDFSDYRNAPAIKFPKDYNSELLSSEYSDLWRGFYMREMKVSLPPEFRERDSSNVRRSFYVNNIIIDNLGFSGKVVATDIIPLSKGDMNGWNYSLDSIYLDVQANNLKQGGFSGGIIIPVSSEHHTFKYRAVISTGGNYVFNVSAADSLQFDVFKTSKVDIYPSSYLEVKVKDGKFLPKANLHGAMNITANLGKKKKGVNLADIDFENLQIQSVKPYIKVGAFSFGSEAAQQAMANFPVSINNIGLKNINDTQVGLDFDMLLNLTGSDGGAFAAEAGLTVVGEMKSDGGQKWRYKDIQVRDISIDIDGGAFKFQGSLKFYRNDTLYGEGFNGQVKAEFKPGIKLQATAIFGNVDGYRYWYADAMASFGTGIPIFTGVGIYGFGGGAYYRMAMDTEGVGSELGRTVSGVTYIPKENAGLGLKATIELGSYPKPEAFTADAAFEIAFFRGGGVRYISFKGNGYLATPPIDGTLDKLKEKTQKLAGVVAKLEKAAGDSAAGVLLASNSEEDNTVQQIYGQLDEASGKGQISAHVFISYDFENRVLHGTFEVYMNIAGGLIQGVGPGGRAGWAVLHFAPDEWYVYAGTPDDRVGVKVGIGPISAQATSYFMVGTTIPGSPPPPEEVSEILGADDLDYVRDLNALGNGAGFAFGAAFSMSTGDLSFAMFYASFAAGAGFDIMLKDYGNASCMGRSGPIGINGWYANGQSYAYFQGKIGIRVKVFGKKREVDILNIGAAALLQAKLPNPFWMRGIVGGHFSIFNGLVKGKCKFEVTLGEECELVGVGSAVEAMQVISEITPSDGEAHVNVFNIPQAVFNMPVDEVFELIDLDGQLKSFRIKLDEFKLVSGGYEIPGDIEWNNAHDVAAYNSFDVFPSEKEIKVVAQISFEEKRDGDWVAVMVDGKKYTERREINFTSGIAPDYIPMENIEYSYPVVNQLNFYKDEYNKGYIKLKKGQPELFQVSDEWIQKGRFTAGSGSKTFFDYSYSGSKREINFNLPSLTTNQVYAYELVNLPAKVAEEIDRNVTETENNVAVEDEDISIELTGNEAEGSIDELQEKAVFSTRMRSSRYNTFEAKVNSLTIPNTYRMPHILWDIFLLISYVDSNEAFGQDEVTGNQFTAYQPLISIEADLSDNSFYNNYIYPLVYDGYPIDGNIRIDWRTVDSLGLAPVKAVKLFQEPDDLKYTTDEELVLTSQSTVIRYYLPYYMYYDWKEIQGEVVDRYIQNATFRPRIARIIDGIYPIMRPGSYKIKMKYSLPGGRASSQGYEFNLIANE